MASKARKQRKTAQNVATSDNDNYSFAVDDLVPDSYRGTQRYLDVIQWNLEWFGAAKSTARDKQRWGLVVDILERLNKGKPDPFAGRTPLYGWFTGKLASGPSRAPGGSFDFQILGVHLKAMADGAPQREQSARVLSAWMEHDAPLVDADVLIMGDFNAPPDDTCWAPFHELEDAKKAAFRSINDPSDFSYLWLRNKKDKALSRIDLTVSSLASMTNVVKGGIAKAVRWKPIEEVIAQTHDLSDAKARALLARIKSSISDHLPTFSRFYFTNPEL